MTEPGEYDEFLAYVDKLYRQGVLTNDEQRDTGPYQDVEQALKQFSQWAQGMPWSSGMSAVAMVLESAMMAGVQTTDFEREYLTKHGVDPVLASIIHGWIARAHFGDGRTQRTLPGGPVPSGPELTLPGHDVGNEPG